MNVYVVIIDDQHTHTDAEVFADRAEAIAWARNEAQAMARGSMIDESEGGQTGGWLYHAHYGEGDCIWVMRKGMR